MRVESNRPTKNGGWWHPSGEKPKHEYRKPEPKLPEYVPNFPAMLAHWRSGCATKISGLAEQLHVDEACLHELGTAYSDVHQAYAFPMYNPSGDITGIRLRNLAGEKWAVRGSKAGLFIPWGACRRLELRRMFICEGPTDTAAALTLGFFAIGRHACVGQEDMIVQIIRDACVREVFLCVDNDKAGMRGAEKLIPLLRVRTTIFVPPAKDLREYVQEGGTRELLLSLMGNTICTC